MIRRIVKKFLRAAFNWTKINPLTSLKKNGNLQIGKECQIPDLKINHPELKKYFCNIIIGDDSFLENTIDLLSDNAKVKIGSRVFIGPATNINCYKEIEIGDDVMFSWGCSVMDTDAHSLISAERKNDVLDWKKGLKYKDWSNVRSEKIAIGNKCWIGFNTAILKGVTLGEGCIVGAGSVVTKSFEAYSIIGGNPARLIKKTT